MYHHQLFILLLISLLVRRITSCCDRMQGPGGCPDSNGDFNACWDEGGYCCSDDSWYADAGDGSNNCMDNGLDEGIPCECEDYECCVFVGGSLSHHGGSLSDDELSDDDPGRSQCMLEPDGTVFQKQPPGEADAEGGDEVTTTGNGGIEPEVLLDDCCALVNDGSCSPNNRETLGGIESCRSCPSDKILIRKYISVC